MSEPVEVPETLKLKFELGRGLLKYARLLVSKADPGTAVTVIVHDKALGHHMEIALVSMLESRAATRVVMTEAVVRTLIRDGVEPEQAGEFAMAEAVRFLGAIDG